MLQTAFDLIDTLTIERARSGIMLLGLDFDGTLAPIVPIPDDAALPPDTAAVLHELVRRTDTRVALVSGRGLHDLRSRVGIDGIYFAGNHGLEIEGPGVHRVHQQAVDALGSLGELVALLQQRLDGRPGVIVEDKGLTISVHFRLVNEEAAAAEVRRTVHQTCSAVPGIRATDGRKVVEIRPDVDWHKGRALGFLRDTLGLAGNSAPVLFIGDDRTDEDAFRELGDDGWSIVVGNPPPAATVARASLASPAEVAEFLRGLAV